MKRPQGDEGHYYNYSEGRWYHRAEPEQSLAKKVAKEVAKDTALNDDDDDDDSWGDWRAKGRLPKTPPSEPKATPKAQAAPMVKDMPKAAAAPMVVKGMPKAAAASAPILMPMAKQQASAKARTHQGSECDTPKGKAKAPPVKAKAILSMRGTAAMRPGPMVFGLPHLIQAGRGQRVHIWPTGISMLHNVHQEFLAQAKGGRHFVPVLHDLVRDFKVILPPAELNVADRCHMVIVDARGPMGQEHFDSTLQDHVGTHPDMIEQLLSIPELAIMIGRQLAANWPKVPLAEDDAIGVLVFSQSGRHRSVAWSYLIQALTLAEGYNASVSQSVMSVSGVVHQANCHDCSSVVSHSLLTKAIVNLSLVPCT